MMLKALRKDRIDTVGNLGDELCPGGVRRGGAQRVPYLDHALVDAPHPVDEQAQQSGDRRVYDATRRDRSQPGRSLVGGHD